MASFFLNLTDKLSSYYTKINWKDILFRVDQGPSTHNIRKNIDTTYMCGNFVLVFPKKTQWVTDEACECQQKDKNTIRLV